MDAEQSDAPRVCWVCLDGGGDDGDSELMHGGCACRGSSGFVHVGCLAQAAKANPKCWTVCPTCKQHWTGGFRLRASRTRYELVADRAAQDDARLNAAMQLCQALSDSGHFEEAVELGRDTLASVRSVYGEDHEGTLGAMGVLAKVHSQLGNHADALPLREQVVAARRRRPQHGNERDHLISIGNLGSTHMQMGDLEAALPLLEEAVEGHRSARGEDHPDTLTSVGNRASLFLPLLKRLLPLLLLGPCCSCS